MTEKSKELLKETLTETLTETETATADKPTETLLPTGNNKTVAITSHLFFSTLQDTGQHSRNLQYYINNVNDNSKDNRLLSTKNIKGILELRCEQKRENKYKAKYFNFAIAMNINPPDQIIVDGKKIKLNNEEKKDTGKTYTHSLIGKNDRTQILFDYVRSKIYATCYKDKKLINNSVVIYYKEIMELMKIDKIESVKDLFEKLYIVYTVKYPYIKLFAPDGKYIMTKIFGQFAFGKDSILIHIGDGGNTEKDLKNNLWGNMDFDKLELKQSYFQLPTKEYIVIKHIKEIIRADKTTDEKKITYMSIYKRLNLPEIENNKDTKKTIKEPIQKIIKKLYDTVLLDNDDNELYFYPKEFKAKNIRHWLENSYLIVIPGDKELQRNEEIKAKIKAHKKKNKQKKDKK